VACSLRDLINIEDPEDRYGEALDVIVKLQDNIESSLKRLLAFRESWNNQEILTNRVEHWITMAEKELVTLRDPSGSSMRQFWVSVLSRKESSLCLDSCKYIYKLVI